MKTEFEASVERDNVINNVKIVFDSFELYAELGQLHTINYINRQPEIARRMNESLQSVMNLYTNGEASYEYFNHYLTVHNRTRNLLAQVIIIESEDKLFESKSKLNSFVRSLDNLYELSQTIKEGDA